MASVGLELGISVLIGAMIGLLLDQKLHTTPWLGIAGLVFGVLSGALLFYRAAYKALHDIQATDNRSKDIIFWPQNPGNREHLNKNATLPETKIGSGATPEKRQT